MAAAHLQWCALFLGTQDYTIESKGIEQHGNAYGLSSLPLELLQAESAADPADSDGAYACHKKRLTDTQHWLKSTR